MDGKKAIRSFRDLEVFQNSYSACIKIHKLILPKLPANEKFDLLDQTSRSSKAIPRLIDEGYAKRHQKAGFQKYLDDAQAETNETIVSLEQIRDIYNIETELCDELIKIYDQTSRQLYRLRESWTSYKKPTSKSNNISWNRNRT